MIKSWEVWIRCVWNIVENYFVEVEFVVIDIEGYVIW